MRLTNYATGWPDDTPVDAIGLPLKTSRALQRHSINTVGQLRVLSVEKILSIHNLGSVALEGIKSALKGDPPSVAARAYMDYWASIKGDGKAVSTPLYVKGELKEAYEMGWDLAQAHHLQHEEMLHRLSRAGHWDATWRG